MAKTNLAVVRTTKPLTSTEAQAGIVEMEAAMAEALDAGDQEAWLEAQRRRTFFAASLEKAIAREETEQIEARQRAREAKRPAALEAAKAASFDTAFADEIADVRKAIELLAGVEKRAAAKLPELRAAQQRAVEVCRDVVPFHPGELSMGALRHGFRRVIAEALHDAKLAHVESCFDSIDIVPIIIAGRPR